MSHVPGLVDIRVLSSPRSVTLIVRGDTCQIEGEFLERARVEALAKALLQEADRVWPQKEPQP